MSGSVGLAEMRAAMRARLSERSAGHCERVAATARRLAARNGVDQDAAELAGLLHDWNRDASPETLVAEALAAGVDVAPVERLEPYLLHARLARVELERDFDAIPADVLDAVESHTLGSPSMTALQKVVFVADMIEPERRFDGVEQLRDAAERFSVDECFRQAYACSVRHVVERALPLHPVTVEVWNAYVAEVRS
ncbi:MAG TPA: bis(5'-nucleosyl)-tetraphosphatase (symmetrical) YqeK [Coriobacteriia bacterium]